MTTFTWAGILLGLFLAAALVMLIVLWQNWSLSCELKNSRKETKAMHEELTLCLLGNKCNRCKEDKDKEQPAMVNQNLLPQYMRGRFHGAPS